MKQQEKQFEAVLKKSVAMYSMLTGKPMSEREGRAFIEIFDITEAYLASGSNITSVTVDDKKRYTPPPIHNHDRDHIQGYDWQICVLSRDKNAENSYMVHYAEMPTQAQLDEHFVKFHDRTHYVHVNEWVHHRWEGITDRYDRTARTKELSQPNKVVRTAPAPELRGRDVSASPVSSPWEQEDKPWRIRYYTDATGAVIFHYCDKRPTSAEMADFHHAKCMAVSQARPKDAA